MRDKVFFKELALLLAFKVLLLCVVWFLFFHPSKTVRVQDLSPILLNKDHPG